MYYEWVFSERRRLAQSYLNALQDLTTYYLANQSPKQAVACIEKAIPLDLLNEDLYCLAMRAYAALNDRTNVSRIYVELKRLLRVELNATPMAETDKLYRKLIG